MFVAHGTTDASVKRRDKELLEASRILGVRCVSTLFNNMDAKMDQVSIGIVIDTFDEILETVNYDYIFYPYPSHHQDHQVVQRAMVAALRPGAHYVPKHILMYEYTYPSWSNINVPDGKIYRDITSTIDAKEKAIYAYDSQIKRWPHPVSYDAAIALARVRGMAIQARFAEMFYVVQSRLEIR